MCGICGIATAGAPVDPERLAAMAAMLAHRGPDSDGTLLDGPVGLAARRLSIIDLETGDQPLATEDERVHAIQNGEIYNYAELRALPRGEIDLDALEAFLAFNSIPAPATIFRDCRKLPAGHLAIWEGGTLRLDRFARPAPVAAGDVRADDEAELVEELRARLR